MLVKCIVFFFFFKQKTAYEMRISDWSSDVCSSDLHDDQRAILTRFLRRSAGDDIGAQLGDTAARIRHERQAGNDARRIVGAAGQQRPPDFLFAESEERRVGKERVSTCSSRWSPSN